MDANEIFRSNVEALREARGWSKAKLANLAGMPRENVSYRLRGGSGGITITTAERLASALDVPLGVLFGKDFDPQRYIVEEMEEV